MRIATRLSLGFFSMMLLILLLGLLSLGEVREINRQFSEAMELRYPRVRLLQEMKDANGEGARAARDLVLASNAAARDAHAAEIQRASDKLAKGIATLRPAMVTPQSQEAVNSLGEMLVSLKQQWGALAVAVAAEQRDDALTLLEDRITPKQREFAALMDRLIGFGDKMMAQSAQRAVEGGDYATRWMVGTLVLSMLAAVALGYWIVRSTVVPIHAAVRVAQGVAAGDLASSISSQGASEVAALLKALGDMQSSLRQLVLQVRQGAEHVAESATLLGGGNAELCARTESQAAALRETAASMEELGSTVRSNADNAAQANQTAMAAREVASRGSGAVQEVVQTMQRISDSARQIADITGVIDGIAFQTNILALNAAVEAARAGESGRGFAVVAGEVRSLAQRCAEAAKQIKSLIAVSGEHVEEGAAQVEQAGATMASVVEAIQRVSTLVNEISTASAEQRAGVEQVGEAVSSIDRATQESVAIVEQTASAATSMQREAAALVQSISAFRL